MQLKLLREKDGYSFYENPNADVVEKIKNYPTPTKINHYKGVLEHVQTLENGKFLLKSEDGDLQTMCKEDFEDAIERTKLEQINEVFDVNKTFNHFLPIHNGDEKVVKMSDKLLKESSFKGSQSATSVRFALQVKRLEFNNRATRYVKGSISHRNEIKFDKSICSNCTYFTLDGEIANRNYNYNFNEIQEPHDVENEKNKFIKYVVEQLYGNIEHINNEFYCSNYYFCINETRNTFSLNLIPKQSRAYYIEGESYCKKNKPKTGLITVSNEALATLLDEKISQFLIKLKF
jgi:hypothetical protein